MSNRGEFDQLKAHVRERAPVTTDEVREAVVDFFKDVEWSLLKDEWQNHMTDLQREALYSKLLTEAVLSNTAKMKRLNLDNIDID